jgi:hypothetical protein
MSSPYRIYGRRQVQLSMQPRDLDDLNELIELVKKDDEGWRHRIYGEVSRSSVVIDLVRADLKRRKEAKPAAKTKRKARLPPAE